MMTKSGTRLIYSHHFKVGNLSMKRLSWKRLGLLNLQSSWWSLLSSLSTVIMIDSRLSVIYNHHDGVSSLRYVPSSGYSQMWSWSTVVIFFIYSHHNMMKSHTQKQWTNIIEVLHLRLQCSSGESPASSSMTLMKKIFHLKSCTFLDSCRASFQAADIIWKSEIFLIYSHFEKSGIFLTYSCHN